MATPYADDIAVATYLHHLITRSKFAAVLGWTVEGGSYTEIVRDTVEALGDTPVSSYTVTGDIQKLRVAARVMLYRAVLVALVTSYDVSLEGNSFSRSQMLNGAKLALTMAESEAEALGLNLPASGVGTVVVPPVQVSGVAHPTDPYRLPPIWERWPHE